MSDDDPSRQGPALGLRLLGVLVAALLLLALVLAITRSQSPPADGMPAASPSDEGTPTTSPSTSTSEQGVADVSLLEDPDRAEAAGAEAVLAAGRRAALVDWLGMTTATWQPALDVDRPVYVGEVTIDQDRSRVTGDVVIAIPSAPAGPMRLRFLPGSSVLADAGANATITAHLDGQVADATLDPDGALVTITAEQPTDGGARLLRLRFEYLVPAQAAIADTEGPAGFGILARSSSVTMLGHGLPLLTFDAAPMVNWGDVGAFPVAIWSVLVHAEGKLVTGGDEGPCPPSVTVRCQWARGTTLRDLALAVLDTDATSLSQDGHGVHAGPDVATGTLQTVAEEVRASLDSMTTRLGELPMHAFDVVMAPLAAAAGMEFPGLVVIDPEYLDRLGGGFGTFVIAHEVAHQWFHALVGNSSLADPVVDESLAQYASLWMFRDVHGEAAAAALAERRLAGRYRDAKADGIREQAPASPLADFGGNDVYGPMAYARSPYAWLIAEDDLGEEGVVAFLRTLVARAGLSEVTARGVRDLAQEQDLPSLVAALDRWWFDPAPVLDELP